MTIRFLDGRRPDVTPIAVEGDRLVLFRADHHGASRFGGEAEISHLGIAEINAEGLLAYGVMFDPDDLDAAQAELEGRRMPNGDG